VVVGHGLLEQVDLLEEKLADLGDSPDLELVDDVADVVARSRI
jgi:hypothetical protein